MSDDNKRMFEETIGPSEETSSDEEDFEALLNSVDIKPEDLEEALPPQEKAPPKRTVSATREKTLDLHGHDQEQAYRLLYDFLVAASKNGLKEVEVITGRGLRKKHGPENPHLTDGVGVLKQMVPRWLDTEKFDHLVKSVTESKTKGGFIIALK